MELPITYPSTNNLSPEMSSYFDIAKKRIIEAKSENTWRAYRSSWKDFDTFCQEHSGQSLPATAETVAAYIASLEQKQLKASTIKQRLVAISQVHQYAGIKSPTGHFYVREALKGTFRRIGVAQEGKKPIWLNDLRTMLEVLPDNLRGLRDRALLVIGFAGAFRRSELAALNLQDVEWTQDGLVINIRKSKTDQFGEGEKVALPYGNNRITCPVRSLQEWIEAAYITDGAIFRHVNRHGHVLNRLSDHGVWEVVKRSCEDIGLDPKYFGGHSLRSGFVTEASRHGKSEYSIMKQTRHKSTDTLRKYIRDANLFNDNPASGIGL